MMKMKTGALLVLVILLSFTHTSHAGTNTTNPNHTSGTPRSPSSAAAGGAQGRSGAVSGGKSATVPSCASAKSGDLVFACQAGLVVKNATVKIGKGCDCKAHACTPVTCSAKLPNVTLAHGHQSLAFKTSDLFKQCAPAKPAQPSELSWVAAWSCDALKRGGSGSLSPAPAPAPVAVTNRNAARAAAAGKLCKVATDKQPLAFDCPAGKVVRNPTAKIGRLCTCSLNACSAKGGVTPVDISSKVAAADGRPGAKFEHVQLKNGTAAAVKDDRATIIAWWTCGAAAQANNNNKAPNSNGNSNSNSSTPPPVKSKLVEEQSGDLDSAAAAAAAAAASDETEQTVSAQS